MIPNKGDIIPVTQPDDIFVSNVGNNYVRVQVEKIDTLTYKFTPIYNPSEIGAPWSPGSPIVCPPPDKLMSIAFNLSDGNGNQTYLPGQRPIVEYPSAGVYPISATFFFDEFVTGMAENINSPTGVIQFLQSEFSTTIDFDIEVN